MNHDHAERALEAALRILLATANAYLNSVRTISKAVDLLEDQLQLPVAERGAVAAEDGCRGPPGELEAQVRGLFGQLRRGGRHQPGRHRGDLVVQDAAESVETVHPDVIEGPTAGHRGVPEPGAREVRIHVQACGICHSDSLTREGTLPGLQYPRVPGHEVIGSIDAVGPGVVGWKPGQRVGVGWYGGSAGIAERVFKWNMP